MHITSCLVELPYPILSVATRFLWT